jgi:DNA-binding GntR family transcriptional regulator
LPCTCGHVIIGKKGRLHVKINKKKLSEQIYEVLKADIISHRISFGERLTNRDLQIKYDVSSSPIRDAINHLYLDGLVENITNSGAKVITFDLKFALEVNDMVSMMCCAALEFSAVRADTETIYVLLANCISEQESSPSDDEYFKNDYLFHKTFFDYCGNMQLSLMYERYHVLLEMLVRHYHNFQRDRKESISQHSDIINIFRTGDIIEASRAMREHFIFAGELFKKYMV